MNGDGGAEKAGSLGVTHNKRLKGFTHIKTMDSGK